MNDSTERRDRCEALGTRSVQRDFRSLESGALDVESTNVVIHAQLRLDSFGVVFIFSGGWK